MAKTEKPTETPKPRISVLERRLQNPFGEPSFPIQLKDPGLICRWFNGAISSDKVWRAKHVKGWDIVTPEMVVSLEQIGGHQVSVANQITRGPRGEEVLMCMPMIAYDQIAAAKSRENNRNIGNPAAMKAEIVNAAGNALGDESADALHRGLRPVGGVTDQFERIQRNEAVE